MAMIYSMPISFFLLFRGKEVEIMIKRFESKQGYEEWLRWQSLAVKDKATKFAQQHGEDVLPIVLILEVDSSQTGERGTAHIFLHPQGEEFLKWVVGE